MQPFTALRNLLTLRRNKGQMKPRWYAAPKSDGWTESGRTIPAIKPNDDGYSLAYRSISDIFACVNLRAETIAQLEIKVVKIGTDEEVTNTRWHDMLDWGMSEFQQDLMYLIEYGLSIWGESFLLKLAQDESATPGGVQWLNPSATTPQIEDGYIQYFEYQGGDGNTHDFTRDQIGYYYYRDPDDDNLGLTPLRAALDAANIKRNSQAYIEAFFGNNATVGGILSGRSKSNAYGGSTVPLSETDQKKLITQWNDQSKGARKAWKTKFMPWDVEYTPIGGEPPTAQIELTGDQRRNIHQVYRVPMSMTQAADASDPLSSGATITADEGKFLSGWAIPEHKLLLRYLNASIMRWLAPGLALVGDYDDVLGMITDTSDRRDMLRADLNAGAMTLNRYRILTGEEPIDNGEVLFLPDGMTVASVSSPFGGSDAPTASGGDAVAERNKIILDQMNRAIIDVFTAGQLMGRDPSENLRGMYWVGNQLVPESELQNIWKYGTLIAPSTSNADLLVQSDPEILPEEETTDLPQLPEPDLPTPPDEPNEARALVIAEYEAWRKFLVKRVKAGKTNVREFNVECIPDEWAFEMKAALQHVTDAAGITKLFDDAIEEHKTAQSRLLAFERQFRTWMNAMEKGTISGAAGRRRLANDWRVSGTQMFTEGLIDGGRLDGKLTKQERRELNKLVTSATPFIRKLGDNLVAGNLTRKQKEMRVTSWGQTFMQFYQDGIVSANKDQMLLFTGKDGSENCRTCKVLKGQVHTAGEWKERELRPGIDHHNFECGTWDNCHHILTPAKGKTKGTLPDAATIRGWAAKACTHDHVDDAPPLDEQPYTIEQYDKYWDTNGHDPEYIGGNYAISSITTL